MQTSVNMLPATSIRQYSRKRTAARWTKAAMISMAVSGIVMLAGQSILMHHRDALKRIEAEDANPLAVQAANTELRNKLRQVNHWTQKQIQLRSAYSPLPVLGLLTQLKEDLGGALEIEAFEFSEHAKPQNEMQGYILVTLKTDNPGNSARIVQGFRASEMFQQVKLQSSLETLQSGSESDLRFSIRCDF